MTSLLDRIDWLSAQLRALPEPPETAEEMEPFAAALDTLTWELEAEGADILTAAGGGAEVRWGSVTGSDETLHGAMVDWLAKARSRMTFAVIVNLHPLELAAERRRARA